MKIFRYVANVRGYTALLEAAGMAETQKISKAISSEELIFVEGDREDVIKRVVSLAGG